MKKIFALLLSLTLVITLATGCGSSKKGNETDNNATPQPTKEAEATKAPDSTETPDATAAAAKTGIAVITSAGKSKAASAEGDGTAQFDSVVVGVLVGQDGKILDCKIDTAQTKIAFSAAGALTTPADTVFQSKQELGAGYGMSKASSIGKDWFEQANAFAAYVIGKTLDEVKGIAVDESTKPTDAELAASVTMSVGGYIEAIDKAVANAKELGAVEGDKLGLAIDTAMDGSKDATADAEGVARAYSNYAAVTVNAEGTITSCAIDASQSDVKFDQKGAITTDLAATFKTKQELGADYGMVKNSSIGKEWFEQADAFAAYVVGKTADGVSGIALTEETKAADAELSASVTMKVAPYISVVTKAVGNAK